MVWWQSHRNRHGHLRRKHGFDHSWCIEAYAAVKTDEKSRQVGGGEQVFKTDGLVHDCMPNIPWNLFEEHTVGNQKAQKELFELVGPFLYP